jgi:hypothetical protein
VLRGGSELRHRSGLGRRGHFVDGFPIRLSQREEANPGQQALQIIRSSWIQKQLAIFREIRFFGDRPRRRCAALTETDRIEALAGFWGDSQTSIELRVI